MSEPAVQSESEKESRSMGTITALFAAQKIKGQSLLLNICLYLTNPHHQC